jgi:hypothetical protein
MLFLRMARTWLYAAASLEGRLIRPAADQFFGHPTVRHECCCGHSTKTVRQYRQRGSCLAAAGRASGCGRWTLEWLRSVDSSEWRVNRRGAALPKSAAGFPRHSGAAEPFVRASV